MSRYIDADLIEKKLTENGFYELDKIPTADVVPVVHGKWVEKTGVLNDATFWWYECSNCEGRPLKQWNETILSDYCPWCGARMDEKIDL